MAEKVNFLDILNSPQWTTADGKGNILAPFQLIGNSFGAGKRELQRKKDLQQRTEATVPQMAEGEVQGQAARTRQTDSSTAVNNAQIPGITNQGNIYKLQADKMVQDQKDLADLQALHQKFYGADIKTPEAANLYKENLTRQAYADAGMTPESFNAQNTIAEGMRKDEMGRITNEQDKTLAAAGRPVTPSGQAAVQSAIQQDQFNQGQKSQASIHSANNKTSLISGLLHAYTVSYDPVEKRQILGELQRQGYLAPNSYEPTGVSPEQKIDGLVRGQPPAAPAPAKTSVSDSSFLPSQPASQFAPPVTPGLPSTGGKEFFATTPKAPTKEGPKKLNSGDVMAMLEKFKVQTPNATPLVDLKSLEALLDASKDAPETLRNRVNVGRGELEADLSKVREMIRQLQNSKGAK